MAERKRVRRNTLERRCLGKSFKRLFRQRSEGQPASNPGEVAPSMQGNPLPRTATQVSSIDRIRMYQTPNAKPRPEAFRNPARYQAAQHPPPETQFQIRKCGKQGPLTVNGLWKGPNSGSRKMGGF